MNGNSQEGMELARGDVYAGRYRVAMAIGKGGMGRVYLAEDLRLGGKRVALKLTRPLPEERKAFLLEAELLGRLEHPHLPSILDYYPPDGNGVAGIVMDYVAGDTLAERFERNGQRLPFALVLRYSIHLCRVLEYLHSRTPSIVFRDLKPANVLVDRHDNAVLVDFGIARLYRPEARADTLMLGTPGFAAPEQLRGEQSDGRTDLYGLGALAYYLLSGGRFAMSRRGSLKQALNDDVPAAFLPLLSQLLEDDPAERHRSASELLRQLSELSREEEAERLPSSENASGDVAVAAVVSAYPGAGATFVTLALSDALSRAGIAHAVAECPGGEGELYSLMDGGRRMPKEAVFSEPSGLEPCAPAWRSGNAAYYPMRPDDCDLSKPGDAYASWLRRLGVPIVLLDVSSRWGDRASSEWLARAADRILFVADPFPSKWSLRRQEACAELSAAATGRRKPAEWIANRDQPFASRSEWLSMFPAKPIANVPDCAGPELLSSLWRRTEAKGRKRLSDALGQALDKLAGSFGRQ